MNQSKARVKTAQTAFFWKVAGAEGWGTVPERDGVSLGCENELCWRGDTVSSTESAVTTMAVIPKAIDNSEGAQS